MWSPQLFRPMTKMSILLIKITREKTLLHFIQEEVEVSGVARENEDKKILAVQKYILKKV